MGAFSAISDLVLGSRCFSCGAPGAALCRHCGEELISSEPNAVVRPLAGFPPTIAAGLYDDVRQACIVAAKERHAWSLTVALGAALSVAVATLGRERGLDQLTMVPMPSSTASMHERGADTILMTTKRARMLLRLAGVDARIAPCLRIGAPGKDQGGLDRSARLRNMSGRMLLHGPCPQGNLVLVDDVVTTGATLCEAHRVLQLHGAVVHGAATIAAAGWR